MEGREVLNHGHNFKLNSVFQDNAREYVTRPVKAMRYQPRLKMAGWFILRM